MKFTTAEKLQIAILCDMAKAAEKRKLDYDFISRAVAHNDIWAIHWNYQWLGLDVQTPPEVKQVVDILDMFDRLEVDFGELSPDEKTRVESESYCGSAPRFEGFAGGSDQFRIAMLLVHDLDRWERFKHRDLDSHMPNSIEVYGRMIAVWRPLWDKKIEQTGNYELAADELIAVLRERIHPEYRKTQPGGDWIYEPAQSHAT